MSVYQRGKTWCVRIWLNGKKIEKAIGPERYLAEAVESHLKKERALAKTSAKEWTGIAPEPVEHNQNNKRFFADAASSYLDDRIACKVSTRSAYASIFKVHLLPAFGKNELEDITPAMIRKFRTNLLQGSNSTGKPVSPARINCIMQLLSSVLQQEYADQIIERIR